jgi:hypothetical protein
MGMIPRSRLSVLTAGGADLYAAKVLATCAGHLLAYWPLSEGSGTTIGDESGSGRHGTYSGVTLGQPGIGDGWTCPWFDGVNDQGDAFSASLASAWDWSAFSVAMWVRMNAAGCWSDGSNRRCLSLSSGGDFLMVRKAFQNNLFNFWLRMDGSDYASSPSVGGAVGGDWFHVGFGSQSGGNAYRYINGVQSTHKTGVGSPSGNALSAATISASAETHHGWLAHVALWDTQLSADQMAVLASVP